MVVTRKSRSQSASKPKNEERLSRTPAPEPPEEKKIEAEPRISETKAPEPAKPKEDPDYLRQYEIDWASGLPYFMLSGATYVPPPPGKRRIMKEHLLKQKKVSVIVPRKDGESAKVLASVCLNGYRLDFPKQLYLELPEQVALLLIKSSRQTEAARSRFLIDRSESHEGITIQDALS